MTFIATEPQLLVDRVRITVPSNDLDSAVNWVQASIRAANQTFEARVMTRRRREAAEREAQEPKIGVSYSRLGSG
jgi:hypothetical protein